MDGVSYPKAQSHTAGPWGIRVNEEPKGHPLTITAHDPESPHEPWCVAEVVRGAGYDEDPTEANARLIAAAPEMKTALVEAAAGLEFALSLIQSYSPNGKCLCTGTGEFVCAPHKALAVVLPALAKAEGRQ